MKLTKEELEMLAGLLANANVPVKDAMPVIQLLQKLQQMAKEVEQEPKK